MKNNDNENHTEALTDTSDNNTCCIKHRLKSWGLWVSLLGLLGLIMQSTGLLKKMGLDSDSWNAIIASVGTVLTAFGIVNNPTDHEKL